jgi:amino acid adenylation domain-containing protein
MRTAPATLPLTFAQQRLWALDQMTPGLTAYNQISAYRIRGLVHHAALRWALDQVFRRHDGLRAVFPSVRGEAEQRILPAVPADLPVVDLTALPAAQREGRARAFLADDLARPFDLATGPMIRVRLLRIGDRDHVLAVVYHHIVCDGWSLALLFEELVGLYAARLSGGGEALRPMPMSYADYVSGERDRLDRPELAGALRWWCDLLDGAPAVLELPTDRPRPALQDHAGGHHHLILPGLDWAELVAGAHARRMTPFMLGLTAYAALLSRLTGTTDLVVGVPAANRSTPAVEPLIGDFANNLPLRLDISGDPPVAELMRRVRSTALAGFARQEVPFGRLVEELRPPRSLSHAPVVQVMFALHSVQLFPGLPGTDVEVFRVEQQTTTMDLFVECAPYGAQTRVSVRYATALFDADTAARIGEQFGRFLTCCVRSPQTRISEMPLLSADERRTVLTRWSTGGAPYPAGPPVHERIIGHARTHPADTAVVDDRHRLSYGELDTRSARLAALLRDRGVGPDTVVGVHLERELDYPVAVLAVLRAGGAFLPLDPSLPVARLRRMLALAGARVVLTRTAAGGEPLGVPALAMDAAAGAAPPEPPPPRGGVLPGNLMYVMFTSGSTGEPKAVAVPHAPVANYLHWMQDTYRLTPHDRVLMKTPTSFDVSVFELLWPLMLGARAVVVTGEGHRDPAHLVDLTARHGATVAQFVPPMLAAFLDRPDAGRASSLRLLFSGGQTLPPDLAARCLERLPAARLDNFYGPTETTIYVTSWQCRPGPDTASVPIGRPIPGVLVYVLDTALRPVPPGVPGELYVGGVALVRGYLTRPDLTAGRFVPDPFGTPGGRLYRTGDRVRWRRDGTLDFLGRFDDQVKVRGYRIEPAEIEVTLTQHPAVHQAVVTAHRTPGGDEQLVAYLVLAAGADRPADAELRDHLGGQLPAYLTPNHFVVLDRFPLTRNGKLDRAALPAPVPGSGSGDRRGGPRTRAERVVAGIWQELLGVTEVGPDDNFFDLGGHSLLVSKVRVRLLETLGRDVPMVTLYEHPTVAALGRHLRGVESGDAGEHADALRRGRDRVARQRRLLDQDGLPGEGRHSEYRDTEQR